MDYGKDLAHELELEKKRGGYATFAELVRDLARRFVMEQKKARSRKRRTAQSG